MNEKQQKQRDAYIEKLGITTEGELFVLDHILNRDWNRDLILIDIEVIRFNDKVCQNLVHVKCRTRNGSYNFSVSHLGGDGWITKNIREQELYISGDLYHKMD
jgi:hypothetical protein